jgi:hypothetical protein
VLSFSLTDHGTFPSNLRVVSGENLQIDLDSHFTVHDPLYKLTDHPSSVSLTPAIKELFNVSLKDGQNQRLFTSRDGNGHLRSAIINKYGKSEFELFEFKTSEVVAVINRAHVYLLPFTPNDVLSLNCLAAARPSAFNVFIFDCVELHHQIIAGDGGYTEFNRSVWYIVPFTAPKDPFSNYTLLKPQRILTYDFKYYDDELERELAFFRVNDEVHLIRYKSNTNNNSDKSNQPIQIHTLKRTSVVENTYEIEYKGSPKLTENISTDSIRVLEDVIMVLDPKQGPQLIVIRNY